MTNAMATGYYEDGETEDYRVIVDNFPLRVDLLSFNAQLSNSSQVLLDWSTSGEENFFGFEVQRSSDNNEWETLQTQLATGNGEQGVNYYHSTDLNPLKGKSFYRLKLVSGDGKFRYSQVRMITLNKGLSGITIAPVPAAAYASLIVHSITEGDLSVQVTDVNGRLIYQRTYFIPKGTNNIDLPFVQNAADGIYFITTRLNGDQETVKLIIAKK
jgi:hypothetical protein